MKKKPHIPLDPIGRYRALLPENEIRQLEACFLAPPPSSIRMNPLKGTPNQTIADFQQRFGWTLEPIKFCPDGFMVSASPTPPGRTLETRLGYFYIQDAASMLPVELFEDANTPTPLILDLTAAPGGKSTHLASRFKDRGLLIANDGTASRIPALTSTLKTWGAVSSAVTSISGEMFGLWFPETFDIILLDAPCSMENMHSNDKNKREIRPAERSRLTQRQVQLLISALRACKTGGQVVYSTCTLAPEEDEGVLDAVLKFAGNAVKITSAGTRMDISAPGLTEAFGQTYSHVTANSLRLWPHRLGTSGFFAAHIFKTDTLPPQISDSQSRPYNRSNLVSLSARQSRDLSDFLQTHYGFSLEDTLEEQNLTLALFRQSVYSFPRQLDSIFPSLTFRSTGLRVGDFTESGFEISLEWATRFGKHISENVYEIPEHLRPAWSRGEDLPMENPGKAEKGSVLVTKDSHGLVLGTGRVSSRGLKNLLPRHLALKS